MNEFFTQIYSLITSETGALTYQLILAFSVTGALLSALGHWRRSEIRQLRRMLVGLSLLLALRIIIFIIAGLAWQDLIRYEQLLPVLDQWVTLSSLVLIIWLWAFPEPNRYADAATVLVALLVITLGVLASIRLLSISPDGAFNGTSLDLSAQITALVLIVLGWLILVIRRPESWTVGFVMLTIEGVGHLIQLLFPSSTGDYSAAVRLSQMIAYPLLFLLPARLPAIHALELETDLSKEGFDNREVDLRKTIAEDSLIQLLLDLLSSTSPDEVWRIASEVTCRYVDADVSLMVSSIGQEDRLQIRTGYDLRRDLYLPGVELNNQQFPLILDALKQGLPVRLPTSSASPDVSSLCQFYNFTSVGYILVLSVISPKNLPILGVILLTPYSERSWTGDDQVKLERVSVRLAQFLHRNQQFDESQADLVYTRQRIDVIEGQLGRYQNERHKFFEFLELIEEKIGLESKAITILAGLRYSNQTVQGTIQNLQDENRELIELIQLTKQLPPAQEAINLQTDLTKTRKEVALLRSALADAESRLLRAKATTQQGSIDQNRIAVVESISQEIHKSATNINEYAHFLMGGSMGDLGDVQRKMIIQVGEGAERLNYLSLELTNAIISHRTPAEIQRTDLDLNQAVMNSIDQSAQFLKELGIKLRVELQDGLPPVRAERKLLASLLSTFIQSADLLQPKNGAALICNRLITTTPAQGISLDLMIDRSSVVDENLPEFLNSTEGVLSSDLELNASQLPVLATLIEDTEIGLRVGGVPGQDAQISLLFPVSVEMNKDSAGAEGE